MKETDCNGVLTLNRSLFHLDLLSLSIRALEGIASCAAVQVQDGRTQHVSRALKTLQGPTRVSAVETCSVRLLSTLYS